MFMKGANIKSIFFILILLISIQFVFSEAPPALPMEIWGQANSDGSPVADGLNVSALIDGANYAQSSSTQNGGDYDVIITGLDRPLTYNDDPNCLSHDPCIPCIVGYGPDHPGNELDYCIEGPVDGESVNLKIGEDDAQESFSLSSGNIQNTDVSIVTLIIITKSLSAGWNLFSIPLELENNDINEALSSIFGKYQIIWTTNNGVPQSTQNPFNPLTKINYTNSYLIYMTSDGLLNVSGKKVDQAIINVKSGWNLIGYPSIDTAQITTLLAGKDYGIIWTTNNGVPQSTQNPFNPLSQFVSGNGYRLYANSDFNYYVIN